MNLIEVVVSKLLRETPEVMSFELRPVTGHVLPSFAPGAHVDVYLGNGLIRQYSLCCDPECSDHYLIAVKLEPESRGGSRWMHHVLREGDLIRISPPKNNFPLDPSASHYVLLAGGIGVTPIISMASYLDAAGASFELHYFVRSSSNAAFRDVLESHGGSRGLCLYQGLSGAETEDTLGRLLTNSLADAQLYLCGPGPFMDLACNTALARGWTQEQLHLERFSAGSDAPAVKGSGFKVRLVRSGKVCLVAEDQPITAALKEQGVEVPVSCESGVCGTCVTDVLSGKIDHRDVYLTDEEREAGKKMCLCVSRSLTEVLELDM